MPAPLLPPPAEWRGLRRAAMAALLPAPLLGVVAAAQPAPGWLAALHPLFEIASVLICLLVFFTGRHLLAGRRAPAARLAAHGFLVVGLLEAVHLATYIAQAGAALPASPHTSLGVLLLARSCAAAAILCYVLPWTTHRRLGDSELLLLSLGVAVLLLALAGAGSPPPSAALDGSAALVGPVTLLLLLLYGTTLALLQSQVSTPLPEGTRRLLLPTVLALATGDACFLFDTGHGNEGLESLGQVYRLLGMALIYRLTFADAIVQPMARLDAARQEKQRLSHEFERVLDAAPDAIVVADRDSRITYVNASAATLFGYRRSELLGQPVEIMLPIAMRQRHQRRVRDFGAQPHTRPMDTIANLTARHHDGHEIPVDVKLVAEQTDQGMRFTAFIRDVSARQAFERELERRATIDSLTGLPNRWLFGDRLEHALNTARRTGHGVAVLALDLDNFKAINDSHGHGIGDQLLHQVGQRLQQAMRSADSVARLGGDEFAILLEHLDGPETASTVAQRVLDSLAPAIELPGLRLFVGASAGIALYPADAADGETLRRYADLALYEAKRNGRGCFAYFTPELNRCMQEDLRLHTRLKLALDSDGLQVYYQPQVDVRSGEISGVEALLRWTDAELGPVSPQRFVPVAEAGGLIQPLGELVLRRTCAQLAAWNRQGLVVKGSVNLSPQQFRREDLVAHVEAVLHEHGVPPGQLVLEITESTMMHDPAFAERQMRAIAGLGIALALDDFGTGHSSLAYLKQFPVSRLKIDRSFITDMTRDANDRAIVEAVISLARAFGCAVTAEGVEQREQLELLRQMRCQEYQGWYFSKALPAGEATALLRRQHAAQAVSRQPQAANWVDLPQ